MRPLVSVPVFANIGPVMAHFSSGMSCLLMEKQKQQTDKKSRCYLETAPRLGKKTFAHRADVYFFEANDNDQGYFDMYLMARCKHFIVSNS